MAEAFPPASVSIPPIMTGTGTDSRDGGDSKTHALLHASYLYYI